MFDSRVLETAIGLVFLFLGFSLITTALQEFVASAVKLRAITLKSGLKAMLTDGVQGLDFYNTLIGHPAVAVADDSPSYISASQFSSAVIHMLSGGGTLPATLATMRTTLEAMPDAPYKQALLSLFRDGETDLGNFESRVQAWFDQSMDRVSGVYKRLSQYLSLAIGALLCFGLQANAIAIAALLWFQPAVNNLGSSVAAVAKNSTLPDLDQIEPGLAQFHLEPVWFPGAFHFSLVWLVGCAITTIAVTLGAPFWFDLLQNFVSLRGTGPAPARAGAATTP